MALTDAKVRSLRAIKKRFIHWEDGRTGLGVRIAPTGRKTFIFMYRFEGRARMMSIGTYPIVNLHSARKKVAEGKEMLASGHDPGKGWIEDKRAERKAETVADLTREYLDKWAKPRKRSWKEDERKLKVDVLPIWGRRKAKEITRRDVIKLLDNIVDRGSPIAANRTLTVLRKMFNFALRRGIVDSTPCSQIDRPAPENTRDRILSEDEIKAFWNGLDEAGLSEGLRLALKLMLLTAARRGEVAKIERSEIDIEKRIWLLPAAKSKNNRAHTIPLSIKAIGIVKQALVLSTESKWLFPSPMTNKGDVPVAALSISRAVSKNLETFGIKNFVSHDLRRSAASFMASMGIPRLVISKVLGHVEGGVTAIYDRHSYDKEKRQALETWGRKLNSIITGEKAKVVEFKRR